MELDPKTQEQLDAIALKLSELERIVTSLRTYVLIMVWGTVALLALPLIGLLILVPIAVRVLNETILAL